MSDDDKTLKPEDVTEADLTVGPFRLTVRQRPFDKDPADKAKEFEVLLFEVRESTLYYIHLVEDPRFDWFAGISTFERQIVEGDVPLFNAYVDRKHLVMPTWRLTRHTVSRLHRLCLALASKKVKKPKALKVSKPST